MEKSISRRGPQRQETLGPSAPIWDWEVERATLRTECREYREKAEQLEKILKEERQTQEKNTNSLLREIKLKESVMEKRMKDMEEQSMAQLLELQKQLDEERLSRQEIIQNIHAQHDTALQAEEKKYQRRLANLRERLEAKDREYAGILQNRDDRSTTSVLQTPEKFDKQTEVNMNDKSTMTEGEKNALKNGNLQSGVKDMVNSLQINRIVLEQKIDTSSSLLSELEEHRKKEEGYIERMHELEAALMKAREDSQKYKKRLDQSLNSHNEEIKELTEKFMTEARRTGMTFQAQLQNLQSEQADTIREMKEQYETQQEVMNIEHEAALDEMRRTLNFEKAEAIRALNKEWKAQMEDIKASMSNDTNETQTHWEAKIEETKANLNKHIKRLQGEIEVVKERLGQEIQRRKQYQSDLANATKKIDTAGAKAEISMKKKYKELRQEYHQLQDRIYSLEMERKIAYHLALNLLNISSSALSKPASSAEHSDLNDVLREATRQLSIEHYTYDKQVQFDEQIVDALYH